MTRIKQTNEHGYVIAIVAISAMAIVILAGFSVDLGSWYLRATKLQRAADAAALAGAVSLPDGTAASSEAQSTLNHNGFGSSPVIATDVTVEGNTVKTTVTDNNVPTYFVHMFMPSIKITRTSFAERSSTIPLGSPFNVFGTGNLALAGPDGVPEQKFWAAVNGPCSAKEDGDYFLSQYDLNEPLTGSKCHGGGASIANPNYNPGGYMYAISVPAGQTKPVDVDLYDPAYQWQSTGHVINDVLGGVPGEDAGDMDTIYILWDTNGQTDQTKWTRMNSVNWFDGEITSVNKWEKLGQIPAGSTARNYVLQVYTAATQFPYNNGANAFSIIARPTNDADPTTGATPIACDGRKHADTCPIVYGLNAVSSFNNVSGGQTDFYLAALDSSFSGGNVEVYVWDPDQGTASVSFEPPYSSTPALFDWISSDGSSGTNVTSLDTTGPGVPNPNLHGSGRFNDQLVTFTVHIPSDYASHIPPGGDTWWKMHLTAGNQVVSDRITWGLQSGGSSGLPAHLVPKS